MASTRVSFPTTRAKMLTVGGFQHQHSGGKAAGAATVPDTCEYGDVRGDISGAQYLDNTFSAIIQNILQPKRDPYHPKFTFTAR